MAFKVKDHYFKKAKKENFLARSVYKLEEIDQKFEVFDSSQRVLDLGYFPGSWTQYAAQKVKNGSIVGVDIQPVSKKLSHLKNVQLHQKDIFDIEGPESLGVGELFDVVLSDMAPKTSGIKSVDQARSLGLVETVFDVLPRFLRPGGTFVIKVFDSHEAQQFLKQQTKRFLEFKKLKPKSTRSVSKEFFVIGKGFDA